MRKMKHTITSILLLCLVTFSGAKATGVQSPTITSFSPTSGSVGTLVTITGTNLNSPTALTIGGITAIVVSNTGTSLVAMVMPKATTGTISITTANGSVTGSGNFTLVASTFPVNQQGNKLVGTGSAGQPYQGFAVAMSADGNTAIVGGASDNGTIGAVWIYTRSAGVWTQQGNKLIGTGAVGGAGQGQSVALSADGNTAIVGGYNDSSGAGAVWIFTRSASVWSQQGNKLVGTGGIFGTGGSNQGSSVALSADGNTAVVGGYGDNSYKGAVWVFTRSGGIWSQLGSKIIGTTTSLSQNQQGTSVAISADGNTFIEGGSGDAAGVGAVWVFTRSGNTWSQQGSKLVGTGATGNAAQGKSVAINADGNTAIVGGYGDNGNVGALWVFTRSGSTWSQQGSKLVGTGAAGSSYQGYYPITISADGNTAMVGGIFDNSNIGATWMYGRSGTTWTQQGSKLVGTGYVGTAIYQGTVAMSADGNTAIVGGGQDNNRKGAVWIFSQYKTPSITSFSPTTASTSTIVTINGHYFTGATDVSFGGTAANSYTVVNDSTITAEVGGGTSGNVSVSGLGGPGSLAGFTYCVNVTPGVSIAASTNSVCSGTSVRITATATNGGASPIYNFKVSGNSVQSGSSNIYTSTLFNNNDIITCVLTANNVCQTTATANSNAVTMIINSGTHNVTTQTACNSYSWNGQNYTSSGKYTRSYNNANGCASVDTLKLTINTGTHTVTTQTACSSHSWNGQTYNTSGKYTYSYNNANGCASVDTLKLTVNQPTSSTNTASVCSNQLPYSWNGLIFTAAGTQTKTGLTNSKGCDSSATLTLSVATLSTPTISVVTSANNVCSGINITFTATPINGGTAPVYQWKLNGTNVGTNSNTYSSTTLTNNDSVWCILTSNSVCTTTPTATSNQVKMIIKTSPLISPVKSNTGVFITNLTMCTIGGTSTLYNNYLGGTWSSSDPSVATAVNGAAAGGASSSGLLTAVANGTTTITYSLVSASNGCGSSASTTIFVDAVPTLNATTGGASGVCIGSNIALSNTSVIPAGGSGVWLSTAGRATVDAVTGVVTGVNAGTASIKYTITNTSGCSNSNIVSIPANSLPGVPSIAYAAGTVNPQTGPAGAFCNNRVFTLVGSPAGGTWSTTNTSVVTVNSAGLVNTIGVGSGTVIYTYTNANGCSSTRSIVGTVAACVPRGVNGGTASSEKLVASGDFAMYPNPAKTFISLNVKTLIGAGTIVVTDLYGKQVKAQSLSMGTNTIDVSSFAKGIYFVSTITSEGKTTKKLVVE